MGSRLCTNAHRKKRDVTRINGIRKSLAEEPPVGVFKDEGADMLDSGSDLV